MTIWQITNYLGEKDRKKQEFLADNRQKRQVFIKYC